ncbi:MAG: hypothetical protein JWP74_703 [Marmoricola sp.]|nr:hypothetical protein [Marmoricola sp.]
MVVPSQVHRALVLLLAVAALVMLSNSPASAKDRNGVGGILLMQDLIGSPAGECQTADYEFDDNGYGADWQVEGDVASPTGTHVRHFVLTANHRFEQLTFCPKKDKTGVYQVAATYTGTPVNQATPVSADYSTTLTYTILKPTPTALSVKVHRSQDARCPGAGNAHCWLATGDLTEKRHGIDGVSISLQTYHSGQWRTAVSCGTDRGRCGFYVKTTKRSNKVKFRYHFDGGNYTKPSSSKVFRMTY